VLTRLKVSGFKNLVDVDVRFGPFTCIAGANGVGKSNLFDAIHFLSALADHSLVEAAQSIRAEGGRSGDIDSLFHRVGRGSSKGISLEAEMIIPGETIDEFGENVEASSTFLRYSLLLLRREENRSELGPLEIVNESLSPIPKSEAASLFPHSPGWRETAIISHRRPSSPFISSLSDGTLELHSDGRIGRQRYLNAPKLSRTVLSAVNAAEAPTIAVARKELQSWRLLQLEPSILREPDDMSSPPHLGPNGAHLAATLMRIAGSYPDMSREQVCGLLAERLSELIRDLRRVWIDEDEKRNLLTLMVEGSDGTPHPARDLSDGTLRFLTLAVLALDPRPQGLLCFEEPENGIHPERVPAMLRLLRGIPTNVNQPVSLDNPLRQVIINTHSPAVVSQVPDDSLVVAEPVDMAGPLGRFKGVSFGCLPGTWREAAGSRAIARGRLLSYLNPFTWDNPDPGITRVVDRDDIRRMLAP
jgi:predicted ATPase